MPKRSTHTYASEENDDVGQLTVYYCLYCGQNALILDCALESLPKRRTDGSSVIETSKHMHKLTLEKGENKLIKRSGGLERQYRSNCSKCELPVAYQSERENPQHIFILDGSLSAQPKVSFNDADVPPCITPTQTGDVKLKIHVTVQGTRCAITDVKDTVEIQVKDCSYLGSEDGSAEKKQNELMMMFLQKILGLASKDQLKIDMGKTTKNKVLLLKEIPPVTVYNRLLDSMSAPTAFGAASRHGTFSGEMFERMPKSADKSGTTEHREQHTGSGVSKWGDDEPAAPYNPFPDQRTLPSGPAR